MARLFPSFPAGWWQSLATLPWLDMVTKLGHLAPGLRSRLVKEGLYEVLEHESTIEILDAKGTRAHFHKRQRVRYLQDGIIAYQDQAWGDGEILCNYRCTPGVEVDRHRPGHKTYILISLRDVKRRGDEDTFHIEWGIHNGFTRSQELWEMEISHPMQRFELHIIFPAKRPPLRLWSLEQTIQQTRRLNSDALIRLPDGRFSVTWNIAKPRLHERYALKWEW